MNSIAEKFREVIGSILPFAVIVVLLHFLVTPLEGPILGQFLIGALFITVGMPIFLQGIDISISPMGGMVSRSMIRSGSLKVILLGSLLIGFIVTIAEPDMHILAGQVDSVTAGQVGRNLLLPVVSVGVGLLVSLGILRMLRDIALNKILPLLYLIIFGLALMVNADYLAIAFDANGSTTGSVTVPFLLALGSGVTAVTRSKGKDDIDSFGLLGVASIGAILSVMLLGVLSGNPTLTGGLPAPEAANGSIISRFLNEISATALESLLVLMPIVLFMVVINYLSLKLRPRQIRKLATGLVYTWFGLTLFLTGVNAGFLDAARALGFQIASLDRAWLLVLTGTVFGIVTIPAEPSVHVLTRQIEDETVGAIKATTVMLTLSIGVGVAVGLSILRILIPALQLWHILLPGMAIALVLSRFIKPIFVGVAFDSGGVASGTMTATFILPFAQGAAERLPTANVITDAFGVISVVSITPLIALQILGLIYEFKLRKAERLHRAEQIDEFSEEVQLLAEESLVEEPLTKESLAEESTQAAQTIAPDEPATEEPATDELMADELVREEPAVPTEMVVSEEPLEPAGAITPDEPVELDGEDAAPEESVAPAEPVAPEAPAGEDKTDAAT